MESQEPTIEDRHTSVPIATGETTEVRHDDGAPAFCPHCGERRNPESRTCASCGKEPTLQGGLPDDWRSTASQHATSAARDLWSVLVDLGRDPIGGIVAAHRRLEKPARIRIAGSLLAIFSVVLLVLSLSLGFKRWSMGFFGGALGRELPLVPLLIGLLMLPLVLTAGSYLLRRVLLRSAQKLEVDLFAAGVALVPIALAGFVGGLLGLGNVEVASFLMFLGAVLAILMLFTGWTDLGGVSRAAAAWSLPFILVAALWACKVALVAVL